MPTDPLRIAALLTYLAAWGIIAIAAIVHAWPGSSSGSKPPGDFALRSILGTILQVAAAFAATAALPIGPLRPPTFHFIIVVLLAPLAVVLYLGAIRRAPKKDELVTAGVYAWIRHPIYAAFLALLLATCLLVADWPRAAVALALYLGGTELRVAREEAELAGRWAAQHAAYRLRTRWRYLPGVR